MRNYNSTYVKFEHSALQVITLFKRPFMTNSIFLLLSQKRDKYSFVFLGFISIFPSIFNAENEIPKKSLRLLTGWLASWSCDRWVHGCHGPIWILHPKNPYLQRDAGQAWRHETGDSAQPQEESHPQVPRNAATSIRAYFSGYARTLLLVFTSVSGRIVQFLPVRCLHIDQNEFNQGILRKSTLRLRCLGFRHPSNWG